MPIRSRDQNAEERLVRRFLLITPTEERPSGQPSMRWRDYISDLAWRCNPAFCVEPAELSDIAEMLRYLMHSRAAIGSLPRIEQ